jgi:hypothetical protein
MNTLDDLMATGVPDTNKPHKARLALAAMTIAAAAITAAGTIAFAKSDMPRLFARYHTSHATKPIQLPPSTATSPHTVR